MSVMNMDDFVQDWLPKKKKNKLFGNDHQYPCSATALQDFSPPDTHLVLRTVACEALVATGQLFSFLSVIQNTEFPDSIINMPGINK